MKTLKKSAWWEQKSRLSGERMMQAVGDWLEPYPWELFGTMSFDKRASSERGLKCLRSFVQSLGKRPFHFSVLEPNADGIHLHSLLGGVEVKPEWDYGILEIKRYDPQKGARFYVGKLLTQHTTEWDFDLSGVRLKGK